MGTNLLKPYTSSRTSSQGMTGPSWPPGPQSHRTSGSVRLEAKRETLVCASYTSAPKATQLDVFEELSLLVQSVSAGRRRYNRMIRFIGTFDLLGGIRGLVRSKEETTV